MTVLSRFVVSRSPFLEVGALAGYDLYDDKVPAGGVVTGIGRINGYVTPCRKVGVLKSPPSPLVGLARPCTGCSKKNRPYR